MIPPANHVIALVLGLLTLPMAVHKIPEGNVGVYFRGGKLLKSIAAPGFDLKSPITTFELVQTTWQTDRLQDVACGAAKGGTAHLTIEVVNKLSADTSCILDMISNHTVHYDRPLIYDNIPHEVAQFCKNYELEDIYISKFDELDEVLMRKLVSTISAFNMSGCLEIQRVRINRPKLESTLQKRFEEVEHEKKKKDLKTQMKATANVENEIAIMNAKSEKEKEKQMEKVNLDIQKMAATRAAEIQSIRNEEQTLKLRADADALLYTKQKEADGIATIVHALGGSVEAYLELQRTRAFWDSTNKVYYFGDSKDHMPSAILQQGGGTTGVNGATASAAAAPAAPTLVDA